MRLAGRGESTAEEALFRRHPGYIAAPSFRLLGDRAESEDVLQETFLDAMTGTGSRTLGIFHLVELHVDADHLRGDRAVPVGRRGSWRSRLRSSRRQSPHS